MTFRGREARDALNTNSELIDVLGRQTATARLSAPFCAFQVQAQIGNLEFRARNAGAVTDLNRSRQAI